MLQTRESLPTFYGVSGVARAAGVTPEAIRQWEAAGRIPKALRTDAGQRIWPADTVPRIAACAAPSRRASPSA